MAKNATTGALEPAKTSEEILSLVPNVREYVDLEEAVTVFNKDSANLTTDDWTTIVQAVYDSYQKHDAVVVTHGTDTMTYSASAVAFALQNLRKPIVFTGSQAPPDSPDSDAAANLENAFRVATSDIIGGGVFISFGHSVELAVRAQKIHASDYDAFNSPVTGSFMEIQDELVPQSAMYVPRERSEPGYYMPGFTKGIASIRSAPAAEPWMIEQNLTGPVDYEGRAHSTRRGENVLRGIVFDGLGAGNIPEQYHELIELSKRRGVPFVVTSPFLGGSSAGMGTYAAGLSAMEAGAISAGDLTESAAVAKLSWILSKIDDRYLAGELHEPFGMSTNEMLHGITVNNFKLNFVGEITDPRQHLPIHDHIKRGFREEYSTARLDLNV